MNKWRIYVAGVDFGSLYCLEVCEKYILKMDKGLQILKSCVIVYLMTGKRFGKGVVAMQKSRLFQNKIKKRTIKGMAVIIEY